MNIQLDVISIFWSLNTPSVWHFTTQGSLKEILNQSFYKSVELDLTEGCIDTFISPYLESHYFHCKNSLSSIQDVKENVLLCIKRKYDGLHDDIMYFEPQLMGMKGCSVTRGNFELGTDLLAYSMSRGEWSMLLPAMTASALSSVRNASYSALSTTAQGFIHSVCGLEYSLETGMANFKSCKISFLSVAAVLEGSWEPELLCSSLHAVLVAVLPCCWHWLTRIHHA